MTNEKPKKRFLCWVIGMGVSEKDRTPDMAWAEETKEDAAIEEAGLEFEGRKIRGHKMVCPTTGEEFIGCRVRVKDLVSGEYSTVVLRLVTETLDHWPWTYKGWAPSNVFAIRKKKTK